MKCLEPVKPQSCFELPSPELSDQVSYLGFSSLVYTFVVMVSLPTDTCLQMVRFTLTGPHLVYLPLCL